MQKGCKFGCFLGKMLCTYQSLPIFPLYYLPMSPVKKSTIPSFLSQGFRISPLLKAVPSSNTTALIPCSIPSTSLPSLVFTKVSFCINGTSAQGKKKKFFWKMPGGHNSSLSTEHLPIPQKKETQNNKYYRLTHIQNCCWDMTVLF